MKTSILVFLAIASAASAAACGDPETTVTFNGERFVFPSNAPSGTLIGVTKQKEQVVFLSSGHVTVGRVRYHYPVYRGTGCPVGRLTPAD